MIERSVEREREGPVNEAGDWLVVDVVMMTNVVEGSLRASVTMPIREESLRASLMPKRLDWNKNTVFVINW